MSLKFEISFSEEQNQYSKNKKINTKQINNNSIQLLNKNTFSYQQIISFSFISSQANLYKSIYNEKCAELIHMEKEFETLHESISKMLENAKEVKNSLEIQVNQLKEFTSFVFDLYQNKQYYILDYIVMFISQNKTIFNINKANNSKNLTQIGKDIDMKRKKNFGIENNINVDEDFWDTNDDICSFTRMTNKKLIKGDKSNFVNISENMVLEKMKYFLIE